MEIFFKKEEDTLEQHVLESRERRGRRSDRATKDFYLGDYLRTGEER